MLIELPFRSGPGDRDQASYPTCSAGSQFAGVSVAGVSVARISLQESVCRNWTKDPALELTAGEASGYKEHGCARASISTRKHGSPTRRTRTSDGRDRESLSQTVKELSLSLSHTKRSSDRFWRAGLSEHFRKNRCLESGALSAVFALPYTIVPHH